MPLAFLWLWTIQLALRIDAWRAGSGQRIGHWLAAIGEFEALCALASYSAENPADPFPELVEGPACFEAEAVGHPLLLPSVCVRNDVALGERDAGLDRERLEHVGQEHACCAPWESTPCSPWPVRRCVPRGSRLTPLAVGATLRIQDSLQAGRSRFYAEITRVRQMVDLARGPLPLLFLFDEIFNGTNSHDRCVGAEAVVRGLIDLGAIGLVTTHDLTLAQIADKLAPRSSNVHFEDRLEDGKMLFRLSHAAGCRAAQQCPGADARDRAGGVNDSSRHFRLPRNDLPGIVNIDGKYRAFSGDACHEALGLAEKGRSRSDNTMTKSDAERARHVQRRLASGQCGSICGIFECLSTSGHRAGVRGPPRTRNDRGERSRAARRAAFRRP